MYMYIRAIKNVNIISVDDNDILCHKMPLNINKGPLVAVVGCARSGGEKKQMMKRNGG